MRIAIVGIQGIPAKYGGFETLVENLVAQKASEEIHYTVFCSAKDYAERPAEYKGARLEYIPLFHANGVQSIPYDILSLVKAMRGYDAILVLGTSGCIFLPFFRLLCRKRLVINIDGLEHRREKWGRATRRFLRFSEAMAVRYADRIVVDNEGIRQYVTEVYGKPSSLITYGADHALREVNEPDKQAILSSYGLSKGDYALTICRIEPENNCHLILEACAKNNQKLLFIGNWQKSKYGQQLKADFGHYPNLSLVDAVYDLDTLYVLRANCRAYLHGHSAGGTNPSLVEAMMVGTPVIAYDCVYNRHTTCHRAGYFTDTDSLGALLSLGEESLSENAGDMRQAASRDYLWQSIARQYERLLGGAVDAGQ